MSGTGPDAASPRAHACNECKRRKVRCSGDPTCINCMRDKRNCTYTSQQQKLSVTRRRLEYAERLIADMEKAWAAHLPNVNLADTIQQLRSNDPAASEATTKIEPSDLIPETSPAELRNAEDFEFDESQDFDNSTDGMGFLIAEPRKSGYMGPQSGVAALKFLQSLQISGPIDNETSFSLDEPEGLDTTAASSADVNQYINDYFLLYHTAYPILHEGTFRARISGALAKPRDGSWPLLYNIVVAIGAFVGDYNGSKRDLPFYKAARRHLSMDILEKGSLSYVQGLVLMANYLQKRNKPNSGFVLIGIGFSMALAIGLHRDFGLPFSSPFTMEIRRRTWWTLFIFVSGAQLTLGRPAVSLVGVNVSLPRNLDDQDLAVDMEELPEAKDGPTVTSCLIEQVKLAKIANMVQVELLTNPVPGFDKVAALDQNIDQWRESLSSHFVEAVPPGSWFEIPKRVLIWRSFHLRIVLNRPILFRTITGKGRIDIRNASISACLTAAKDAVLSICSFIGSDDKPNRGLAWYATYWLITASFVQATCYAYDPTHHLASEWKTQLMQAVGCLKHLGETHGMAFKACDILNKLLNQNAFQSFAAPPAGQAPRSEVATSFTSPGIPGQLDQQFPDGQGPPGFFSGLESTMTFPWYAQGSSDAELLDATGGIMLQSYSDSTGPYFENGSWMPG